VVDSITQLTSQGRLLAKSYFKDPVSGEATERSYDRAKHFRVTKHVVDSIRDLARVLTTITADETSCVIRGELREGVSPVDVRRTKANFDEVPRRWSLHDFDKVDSPPWVDWRSDPDSAVGYLISLLPPEFHDATCWWTFSGGQGFKPGLNMRLAFWHDRPVYGTELELWLGERMPDPAVPRSKWKRVCPVDVSLYRPVQLTYIAAPLFFGVSDPVPHRSGIRPGRRDSAPTPFPIRPRFAAPISQSARGEHVSDDRPGGGYQFHRSRIGDNGDGFHEPLRAAVGAYFSKHGADADAAWLLGDLTAAAQEAKRDTGASRTAVVAERIAALPAMIDWVREKQRTAEAEQRAPGAVCKAPGSVPTMSLSAAEAAVAAAVADAFGQFAAWRALQDWNANA
jgi:hypothetical protein